MRKTSVGKRWLAVPLAVGLAACGDSGTASNTDTAGMTQGSTVDPPTGTTATTVPTGTDTTSPTTASGSESNGETTTTSTTAPTTTVAPTSTGPDTTTTTEGVTSTTGTTSTTTTTVGTTTTEGTTTTGTTGNQVCEPGDGMGMGPIEKSFIWIPSQDLSDVAKVNTQTLVEVARYKTGPGGDSPSRTAVSLDGRFVVVNNRQTGTSSMFAANIEDCVDKNGNGMIDTSQNKNDVRPWMADECLRWHIQWPFAGGFSNGPRGVTWTPGTWDTNLCQYVEPKVWLGYNAPGGFAHFVRIDGATGTIEETVPVPNWNGQGYAPYGGALDPEFRPWFGGLRGEFVRVNTDQNPITVSRWTAPFNIQSYGFTVDGDGNPWFAGCSGPVSTFDADTEQYTSVPGTNACFRGITADKDHVWVASNGPCALLQIDRQTKTLVASHNTNPCSTAIGLSVDAEKFVWLVDQEGWAWKIDPDNVPGMQQVQVPGSHYVYSDMTGGQLLSIIPM
ncbi:lyase [Nannocystis punicea]|uniref:Lyase n=1 Tax=Nannocystis punicea TaxID=2995304 RepID=A0ABY7HK43_9BACT|nr:lyase [Nannocystis poenicansa]WAS99395.1 lyase [Nannocystis poenicansa]